MKIYYKSSWLSFFTCSKSLPLNTLLSHTQTRCNEVVGRVYWFCHLLDYCSWWEEVLETDYTKTQGGGGIFFLLCRPHKKEHCFLHRLSPPPQMWCISNYITEFHFFRRQKLYSINPYWWNTPFLWNHLFCNWDSLSEY